MCHFFFFRKRSAPLSCSIARVESKPASVQLGSAEVTERGASVIGQPPRGSKDGDVGHPVLGAFNPAIQANSESSGQRGTITRSWAYSSMVRAGDSSRR